MENKTANITLTKTEQKIIDHINYYFKKMAGFDRIQHGTRFMAAVNKLVKKGIIEVVEKMDGGCWERKYGYSRWMTATTYIVKMAKGYENLPFNKLN